MLDKSQLDAVVVCTPHNSHVEPTLAALEHGQHVLLEKPVADTIEAADTLARAAEKTSCVVTVGENIRGMRSWRAVKRALDVGKIGQLRQINVACCMDGLNGRELNLSESIKQWLGTSELMTAVGGDLISASSWRTDPIQMGGDTFFDNGVHIVDLLLWLGGAPAQQVAGMQTKGDAPRSAILTVQARLANGVLLSVTYNDSIMGKEFNIYGHGQLTAYGSTGWVSAQWTGAMATEAQQARLELPDRSEAIDFETEGDSVSSAAAFVSSVLDGAPNLCSVQAGAQVVSLIQSAYRSAAEGRIVTLG